MLYDLIFLGGGPAGYVGAIAAAKKGLKAGLIEMDRVGGVCLQRGCVPTKTLLHSVKLIKQIPGLDRIGIHISDFRIDLQEIFQRKDRVVLKLTRGIETRLKQNNVDLIKGRGKITDENTLTINENQIIKAKQIVIATGSRPTDLPFLKIDGENILSSDDMLELKELPESLLVVGAGAVGVEWAVICAHLGVKVTLVEILDQIIPGIDSEISEILNKELKKQKIQILTATAISNVRPSREITLHFQQGEKEWDESYSKILLSVGRSPNTSDIFNPQLNISLDNKNFIRVNENLQTNHSNIYACGDAIGPPMLAHKASHEAMAIVDYVTENKNVPANPVPSAIFTFPEVATVGISEDRAKVENIEIKVGRFPYSAGSRPNTADEKFGLVKIIADKNDRLLGGHIIGAEASELLPLLTYGIQKRLSANEFKDLIFIHPTFGESIWEALGEISNFSIHL